mgnify:CR=1 FL=1
MKITAFTKLILVLAVTAWVFLLPVSAVASLLVLELVILLTIKRDRMTMAAIGTLTVFTGMMVLLQLLFGSPLYVALTGGLRMFVMTTAFLCLLASTRIQDIAQALVEKFHMPMNMPSCSPRPCGSCRISCPIPPLLWMPSPAGAIPTGGTPSNGSMPTWRW